MRGGDIILKIIYPCSKEDRAMKRWDKSYGMNLSSSNVSDILEIYLAPGNQPAASKRIANSFLGRISSGKS